MARRAELDPPTARASRSPALSGTVNGTLDKTATGAPGKPYTCGSYTSGAIHQVTLSGLAPKTTYFYSVGAAGAASTVRSFVSSPGVGAFYPYTFAAIGDLGQTAYSADTLAHVSASSTVNSAFLSGDVSYADGDQPRVSLLHSRPRVPRRRRSACLYTRIARLASLFCAVGLLPAHGRHARQLDAVYGCQREPRE